MELTEKNGHASIEEILASVRRIIAEEPANGAPLIDLHTPAQHSRGDGLLDDPSDFDLPSMFKSPSAMPAAEKPAPLFGRLSEAIRSASAGAGYNGEASRADQSLSALKLHRADVGEGAGAPHFLLSTFHETTTPRADEIAAAAMPQPVAVVGHAAVDASPALMAQSDNGVPASPAPQPSPQAASAPQVPRQMAAFKDTRFRAMGAPLAAPESLPAFVSPFEAAATEALVAAANAATESEPAPLLVSEPSPPAEELVAVEAPAGLTAAIVASYPALAVEAVPVEPPPHMPPPVPVHAPPTATGGGASASPAPIEDSTADLLRPMLRQWLAENMPRMVEKALHIEVAESVKSAKK